jgi:hypothetical protein
MGGSVKIILRRDPKAPINGMVLRIMGAEAWIEYRPYLGMFDVMYHVNSRRIITRRALRTNDLFAAISCAIHWRTPC